VAARREWTRESLAAGVRAGDKRALARAISLVENADPLAYELVHDIYPETGRAYTVGVTGPPGVGKSTLISALIRHVRAQERTIGVISVDPSSPFTHGALLGDRIRLADHFLDPGVFIRSMGTRGHLGGLAEATLQELLILDAAGKELVFLETVGAGQSEVEVIGIADTVLLVLMPGSGDSVQALKAGIMEIPDVIAVNKMDHPAAKTMLNEVRSILSLDRESDWRPPIVLTDATRGENVPKLWEKIEEHRAHLEAAGQLEERRRKNLADEVFAVASGRAKAHLERVVRDDPELRRLLAEVQARRLDPLSAVREILRRCSRLATQRTAPTLADIQEARGRLLGIVEETPIYLSETFSRRCGREVRLKAENLQRTGAFKIRGAVNRLAHLTPEERDAGVVAASAGNHGQAVAWAAREAGVSARIYVPLAAPMAKVEACRNYGATTELAGDVFEDALEAALTDVEETGATFVHPYEDQLVIAGQGTVGLELLEQAPEVETVLIPIGGGGLALGMAIALRAMRPGVRLVGIRAGLHGYTIADGIAVKVPSEFTMPLLEDLLDDIVDVTDEEISEAIVLLLERAKLVVEGAGAVGVAALLAGKAGGSGLAVPVLSGGNIDATMLISVRRYGLTAAGRYLVMRTHLSDRPGELIKLLSLVAEERGNVIAVDHHREGMDIPVSSTEVELTLLTRDEEHCRRLLGAMDERGYVVERLR
jgi:LAO/AO transport system kinase